MDTNTILAWVLGLVGIGDIAMARLLADKLPSAAQMALAAGGIVFLLASAAFATRLVRI